MTFCGFVSCDKLDVVNVNIQKHSMIFHFFSLFLLPSASSQMNYKYPHLIAKSRLPLHVIGNKITDNTKQDQVRLKCVEWSGSHLQEMVVNGLSKTPLESIISLIKSKFNCIRLSFSLDLIFINPTINNAFVKNETMFFDLKVMD